MRINTYKTNNKNIERLLEDIHKVLLRMENRIDIIETGMWSNKVKTNLVSTVEIKKQVLKGNE